MSRDDGVYGTVYKKLMAKNVMNSAETSCHFSPRNMET